MILHSVRWHISLLMLAGCASSALMGCSEPRPYYYWGSYQDQLYNYFLQKTGPEAQIQALEQGRIQAQNNNQHLPPGYYALMGVIYIEIGQSDKAYSCFSTEKTLFPEADSYMNFLLKIPNTAIANSPSSRPVASPPPTPKRGKS